MRWLNPGPEVVEVTAHADALIRPDAREAGFLDTAVVTLRFDNGAFATAEASFSASYGYDVRSEVFGDGGMATAGSTRTSDMDYYGPAGVSHESCAEPNWLTTRPARSSFNPPSARPRPFICTRRWFWQPMAKSSASKTTLPRWIYPTPCAR